jgi:hypothetical protein
MTAEAAGVVGMVGEVEAIEELAIEPPSLDVQLVGSRRGSHAAFTVTSGTWFKLRLLALLKKLPPAFTSCSLLGVFLSASSSRKRGPITIDGCRCAGAALSTLRSGEIGGYGSAASSASGRN